MLEPSEILDLKIVLFLFLVSFLTPALPPPPLTRDSESSNHPTFCFSWFQIITHIFIIIVLRNIILVIYNATGLEKFVYLNPAVAAPADISILKTAAQKLRWRQRN